MPIINIKFIEGVVATPEQKLELIAKMTDTFAGVLGEVVRPFVYCIIDETPANAWGIGGKPMPDLAWLIGSEYDAQKAEANRIMGEAVEQMVAQAPPVDAKRG
jgi:4-oxalocrotonate tautomerase family enzyme